MAPVLGKQGNERAGCPGPNRISPGRSGTVCSGDSRRLSMDLTLAKSDPRAFPARRPPARLSRQTRLSVDKGGGLYMIRHFFRPRGTVKDWKKFWFC
jgi:hypothetical protein